MSGEKKTLLVLEPDRRIFPDTSVSIYKYFTSIEFPFSPTGYLVDVHYSYVKGQKRTVIHRRVKIGLTTHLIDICLAYDLL